MIRREWKTQFFFFLISLHIICDKIPLGAARIKEDASRNIAGENASRSGFSRSLLCVFPISKDFVMDQRAQLTEAQEKLLDTNRFVYITLCKLLLYEIPLNCSVIEFSSLVLQTIAKCETENAKHLAGNKEITVDFKRAWINGNRHSNFSKYWYVNSIGYFMKNYR